MDYDTAKQSQNFAGVPTNAPREPQMAERFDTAEEHASRLNSFLLEIEGKLFGIKPCEVAQEMPGKPALDGRAYNLSRRIADMADMAMQIASRL